MSNSRQPAEADVRAVSIGFSSGYNWRSQPSSWGQLIWASRGVITVNVGSSLWVVPPQQALWLPATLAHNVRMSGSGTLRRVYFNQALSKRLPREPQVIGMAPLLRELLRRALQLATLTKSIATEARLLGLLMDEIVVIPVAPVELPMPIDPRARRAAEFVRTSPASAGDMKVVGKHANASVRTLERLFPAETGLSFGAWRQRARLLHAMSLLADGTSVTEVAIAVGYTSTSAFVAAFRRAAGVTPGKYVRPPVA